MPVLDDSRDLNDIALFRGLPRDQLSRLNQLLRRKTFPSGATLVEAEEHGEQVYVIRSGAVKVAVEEMDGTEVILTILGAGSIVGEMSLLDGLPHSATVAAIEESLTFSMDRNTFENCLQSMPRMAHNLLGILTHRLRLADEHIRALAALDVPGRVAHQIVVFAREYGVATATGETVIPIHLTQSDLAGLIGASRVHVNRALGDFKRHRYISVDHMSFITVHNLAALTEQGVR